MSLHRLLGYALGFLPGCLLLPALAAQESPDRPPLFISETKAPAKAAPEKVAPEKAAPERATPEGKGRAADPVLRTGVRKSAVVLAVERVKHATVNIHTERHGHGSSDYYSGTSAGRVNGMGTGIIVDPRGYIVTNQHVIEDVHVLRIRLANGSTYHATLMAKSPEMDLALIKIDPREPLQTMPIGTANDLMLGETVIAIGNAFGYEHTVSVGIVSALKRDVSLNKEMSYKSLIQTDASINPGNSGGPLININGELVGVNVAIRAGAQNIGFAIPADHMIRTVAEMIRNKRRVANYDGMVLRDRVECGLDACVRSVTVDGVESGSPAARAGIRTGDVLSQLGDVKIFCTIDVERALLERRATDSIPVVVNRKSEEQKLDLVLASPDRHIRPVSGVDLAWARLGLQLSPVGAESVKAANKSLHGGLEITAVQPESAAAKAGFQKGDILVGLHLWETVNMDNVTFVLNHPDLTTFQPLSFFIVRGTQVRRGVLEGMP